MKNEVESNWHKHRERRATADQIRALQAGYTALKKADDPRVFISGHAKGLNDREQRLKWAALKLGFPIVSFSVLNMNEAAYLIDLVNGEKTKLDRKIEGEMIRLKVNDHAAYFDAFIEGPRSRLTWGFGGRGFNDLNRQDKIKLVEILVQRMPKQEPRPQGSGK